MQSLSAPDLVGLPEHELAKRALQPRGVFCRPGLLVPSDTTVYALLAAQEFNACLPLGPGRPLRGGGCDADVVACRDTATLAARANITHRAARDSRAFYVVQIELDLLTAAARPARGDYSEGSDDDADAPDEAGPGRDAAPRAPLGDASPARRGGAARGGASWRRDVRIAGGVNEEAVTRVWMARRDARGAFLSCDAPTGDENDWRRVFPAC